MRTFTLFFFAGLFCFNANAQSDEIQLLYEVSEENPFGLPHPDYKEVLADFDPMIGECTCKSVNRKPDGTWNDTLTMIWRFKYIMNGMAIQDESWKSDGAHSGSIRQYIADSSAWSVAYFSIPPSVKPGVWMGGQVDDKVILNMDQKAPNGMEGDARLTFFNIDETGFDWIGEWVKKDGAFVYPFWKIFCEKRKT